MGTVKPDAVNGELRKRFDKITTQEANQKSEPNPLFDTLTTQSIGKKAWGIDYLNGKVGRMAEAALRAHEQGKKLELWMKIVLEEGEEVYEYRPKVLLGCYFAIAGFHMVCSASHLSWLDMAVMTVARYIVMDLYSGILHIVLDSEEFLSWRIPGFWKAALEFHWHHEIPQDLSSKPFVEVVGDLIGVITAFTLSAHLIYGSMGLLTHHYCFGLGINFLLAIWLQLGHRMSHTRPADRPTWVKVVQKLQILLPPSDHQKHHQTYDRNFCICHGHCNGLLNWVTQNVVGIEHIKFWFAMWLLMTIVEPWASTELLIRALGLESGDVVCTYAHMGECLARVGGAFF